MAYSSERETRTRAILEHYEGNEKAGLRTLLAYTNLNEMETFMAREGIARGKEDAVVDGEEEEDEP
jgi:predicted TIM-barrel enzyme